MATVTPAGTPKTTWARHQVRRIRAIFLGLLLLFCGGVATGVYMTKRVMENGPVWLQRTLGVAPVAQNMPAPAPASAPTASANISESAPGGSPAADSESAPSISTSPEHPAVQEQAPVAGSSEADMKPEKSSPEHSAAPDPAAAQEMSRQVQDYNDMLRRLRESANSFESVRRRINGRIDDGKVRPEALQPLVDQQNVSLDEIATAARRARSLLAALRALPGFDSLYQEGEPCLPAAMVPTKLVDLEIEKLRILNSR